MTKRRLVVAALRGDTFTFYGRNLGELAVPELPEPSAMSHDAVLRQLGELLGEK